MNSSSDCDSNCENSSFSNFNSSSSYDEEREYLHEAVFKIQQEIVLLYTPCPVLDPTDPEEKVRRRLKLMNMIEDILLDMMKSLKRGEAPKLVVRNLRNWNNCLYDSRLRLKSNEEATMTEVKFADKRSRGKYSLIIFVLGKIFRLFFQRTSCTKRELYYQNCDKITSQESLDSVLNDISCLLDAPLHELNIFSTSKGLVYGPLQIITEYDSINCMNSGGTLIPHNLCDVKEIKSIAKFILVIEKDAIYQKLLDDGVMGKLGPLIMITGKGFPDINTRHLLRILWNVLAIPIFVLVDPDPWGVEIMCIYRFGSLAMSHQAEQLAVPSIRWIGIHPSEIDKFYDKEHQIDLTEKDVGKLNDIINRPYIKSDPLLEKEIKILLDRNCKAEIEGIETVPAYLVNVYLRIKIANGDFL